MENRQRLRIQLQHIFVCMAWLGVAFSVMANSYAAGEFIRDHAEHVVAATYFGCIFAGIGSLFQRSMPGGAFGLGVFVLVALSDYARSIESPLDLAGRAIAAISILVGMILLTGRARKLLTRPSE
jgi:hypothetical protein